MIICSSSNIDLVQGVDKYGTLSDGSTDWRIENTTEGVFNILNSTSTSANISLIDNGNIGIGTTPITGTTKLQIQGNMSVSGTTTAAAITSSGLITANAGISVPLGQTITSSGNISANTMTTSGLITANAGISVPLGQTITSSGNISANTMTTSGLITANGGITTGSSSLITANNGITVNTGSLTCANDTLSKTYTATNATAGTNDIFTMRYDTTNGIRWRQEYIAANDVRYSLVQKVNNVDQTNSLQFYKGNVGIATSADTGTSYKLNIGGNVNIPTGSSYMVNGVALSTSSTQWVGTTNIYYNSGNVGIGATTTSDVDDNVSFALPTARLYVRGGESVGGTCDVVIRGGVAGQANGKARLWLTSDAGHSSYIQSEHTVYGSTQLTFGTATTDSLPAERMRITSSGNVGIGTANPQTLLHIEGSILVQAFENNAGGTKGIFFRNGYTDAPNQYNCSILTIDHNGNNFCEGLSINGGDGVSFCAGGNTRVERMRINQDGNVGIGTATPQSSYKLQVQGNAWVENQLVFNNNFRGSGGSYACNKISLYGGVDTPTTTSSYGFGMAGGALEYFTNQTHIWYTGTEGGTNYGTERMRLTSEGFIDLGSHPQPFSWTGSVSGQTYVDIPTGFNLTTTSVHTCEIVFCWNLSGTNTGSISLHGLNGGTEYNPQEVGYRQLSYAQVTFTGGAGNVIATNIESGVPSTTKIRIVRINTSSIPRCHFTSDTVFCSANVGTAQCYSMGWVNISGTTQIPYIRLKYNTSANFNGNWTGTYYRS